MKQFIIFLIAFLSIASSFACINGSGKNIFGEETFYDSPFYFFDKQREQLPKSKIKSKLKELTQSLEKEYRTWDAIDLSVYLIYDNQLDSAISVLHKILNKDGDKYSVYSNLGVAFELKGNLDSAYYWTKKGVDENPNSHYESEWIHLKILEAQIALQTHPNWLNKNTVLGFEISSDSLPIKIKKSEYQHQDLANQIEYQLHERMYFVKPKNKIVGQLLLQLADLYSISVSIEDAIGTYLLAKEYDPMLKTTINKRLAKIQSILTPEQESYKDSLETVISDDTIGKITPKEIVTPTEKTTKNVKEKSNNFIWYIFGGTLLIILLIVRIRLSKNQQKKK